jgi:TonB family protein
MKVFLRASLLGLMLLLGTSQLQAQAKPPLTLADILTALRSKRIEDPEEKNRLLIEAVIERGVTFSVSPEIEKELEITGASKALIDAIKLKSPGGKANTTPTPAPSPSIPDYKPVEERADMYAQKGEYDLAVFEYNRAIELSPKNATLYVKRGFAFFNKKNFDLALADYNKAIELDPKEAKAYFYRAALHERNNNITKAIEDYQKAVELDQNNEQAKANLKRLQEQQAKTAPTPTPPQEQIASKNPVQPPLNRTTNNDVRQPQPKVEQLKEPKEQPKEQPKVEQPKEPKEQPKEQPKAEKPKEPKEQPKEQPKAEKPKEPKEQPKVEQPKEQPKAEKPKESKEQPTSNEPKKNEASNTEPIDGTTVVGVGQLTSSDAVRLVKPTYPLVAQRSNIEGQVRVEVTLDEEGNVISAKAVEGPALLRTAAEEAAMLSKFKPVILNEKPVKAKGFIVYNFTKTLQEE